jgi:predicted nucleic acid-binding protein
MEGVAALTYSVHAVGAAPRTFRTLEAAALAAAASRPFRHDVRVLDAAGERVPIEAQDAAAALGLRRRRIRSLRVIGLVLLLSACAALVLAASSWGRAPHLASLLGYVLMPTAVGGAFLMRAGRVAADGPLPPER